MSLREYRDLMVAVLRTKLLKINDKDADDVISTCESINSGIYEAIYTLKDSDFLFEREDK